MLSVLAWLTAGICIAVSLRALKRVSMQAAEVRELGRLQDGRPQVGERTTAMDPSGGQEGGASSGHDHTVEHGEMVAERLREVGYATSTFASLPAKAGRISLATGALIVLIQFTAAVATRSVRQSITAVALSFVAGVTGAIVCFSIGHTAKIRAQKRRSAWQKAWQQHWARQSPPGHADLSDSRGVARRRPRLR